MRKLIILAVFAMAGSGSSAENEDDIKAMYTTIINNDVGELLCGSVVSATLTPVPNVMRVTCLDSDGKNGYATFLVSL